MHNLYGSADSLELRSLFNAWWKACEGQDFTEAELLERFQALRRSPAFRRFCAHLLETGSLRPSAPAASPTTAPMPAGVSLESMER